MLSNYDVDIQYYPKKASNATDTLSKKTYDTLRFMRKLPIELAKEIKDLDIMTVHEKTTNLVVQPIILKDIRKVQEDDEYLAKALKFNEKINKEEFTIASNSTVRFK